MLRCGIALQPAGSASIGGMDVTAGGAAASGLPRGKSFWISVFWAVAWWTESSTLALNLQVVNRQTDGGAQIPENRFYTGVTRGLDVAGLVGGSSHGYSAGGDANARLSLLAGLGPRLTRCIRIRLGPIHQRFSGREWLRNRVLLLAEGSYQASRQILPLSFTGSSRLRSDCSTVFPSGKGGPGLAPRAFRTFSSL